MSCIARQKSISCPGWSINRARLIRNALNATKTIALRAIYSPCLVRSIFNMLNDRVDTDRINIDFSLARHKKFVRNLWIRMSSMFSTLGMIVSYTSLIIIVHQNISSHSMLINLVRGGWGDRRRGRKRTETTTQTGEDRGWDNLSRNYCWFSQWINASNIETSSKL